MNKYDFKKIEKKWQKTWKEEGVYEPDLNKAKSPFYNLMMFPYPSAEGLHVGNMYAFVGSDIYGRFKRMQGNDVFEPIGLDGFGIHSENYALKAGTHPMEQAKISEKRFYEQLEQIGNGFAWEEKLETYDPKYYRWTQWLFLQMFKNGLAYRKKQEVNWCPSDKTVLADEQVIDGKCERCGTEVVKKELEQWFFKITQYAERLLQNLEKLDWSEKVKVAQRNWIGKSEGAEIDFLLDFKKHIEDNNRRGPNGERAHLRVFTTRPDTLFGVTYLVLSPEHLWVTLAIDHEHDVLLNKAEVQAYVKKSKAKSAEERIVEGKEKTGVELKGVKAVNPANGEEIPIFVADYVLSSYGTGAIMAVPAHDERDFEFAQKFELPIRIVITAPANLNPPEPYTGYGYLQDSEKFNGMDSEKAKWEITKFVGGERQTQYRLRDWLISRQRYWGPPIPMIFCESCARTGKGERVDMPGWYVVPEKDLPVELPFIKDFRPTGKEESPLAAHKEFYEVKCPACKKSARRETDVSDTFLDSAWYYLRYLNPKNKKSAFDAGLVKNWLPVEMYIGGAEHAVLHLLYVRFVAMALYDWGLLHFDEPMKKFRANGLLIKDGAKMSKSKGNVINPDEYIKNFGADALRMYLMFIAPFEQGGDFRDAGILGIERFLQKVWRYGETWLKNKSSEADPEVLKLEKSLHRAIKKLSDDIENLHFNTAISTLMVFMNEARMEFESERKEEPTARSAMMTSDQFGRFAKLLAPFAPHMAEEIWRNVLAKKTSIHLEAWPKFDEKLTREEKITLVIQVNGKFRDSVEASAGISEEEAGVLALGRKRIMAIVGSQKPKRIIYIPDKLINIVL